MSDLTFLEWWEFLSYIATVVGIPMAIFIFFFEERKERRAEQEEIYDTLMEHYNRILDRLFEHPEIDRHDEPPTDPEQARRQKILYEMLVTLFERSFILLYGEEDAAYKRMWNSWEDYIQQWSGRANFRTHLPSLMRGEDPEFVAYMARITGLRLDP